MADESHECKGTEAEKSLVRTSDAELLACSTGRRETKHREEQWSSTREGGNQTAKGPTLAGRY